jgi:hypothetical protein
MKIFFFVDRKLKQKQNNQIKWGRVEGFKHRLTSSSLKIYKKCILRSFYVQPNTSKFTKE